MSNFNRLVERAIVRALIQECDRAGFMPHHVDDGGENVPCSTEHTAVEAIFAVDDARLFFRSKDDASRKPVTHGVYLVGGNGEDIISDWHCGNASFNAAVDRVAMNVGDLIHVTLAPFEPCTVSAPDGATCSRPAGHAYEPKGYHPENHESKDYKRW